MSKEPNASIGIKMQDEILSINDQSKPEFRKKIGRIEYENNLQVMLDSKETSVGLHSGSY